MDNKNIILIYTKDDILKSEPYSVITHACNTLGFWGAGIAKQMRDEYPIHYKEYNSFCKNNKAKEILGGCLLLDKNIVSNNTKNKKHHIACLFTNLDTGKRFPSEEEIKNILSNTKQSMESLLLQVEEDTSNGTSMKDIHMPKINSGYFGVPWERTEECIRSLSIDYKVNIYIHII